MKERERDNNASEKRKEHEGEGGGGTTPTTRHDMALKMVQQQLQRKKHEVESSGNSHVILVE